VAGAFHAPATLHLNYWI